MCFVLIHSIYSSLSEVLSGVPFITVICNSIMHTLYFLFTDTIKIAHSINSAIDSTLPQSDIDSICGWCAADMKINTDETKTTSTMSTTYCLNGTKCWNPYVLWPNLLLLTVPYCYITHQFVLSRNRPHLPAVTLWLLMPIGWNTSNRSRQLCASFAFFHYITYNHICVLYLLKFYISCFRRHQPDSLFTFTLSYDQNFVLSWLIIVRRAHKGAYNNECE